MDLNGIESSDALLLGAGPIIRKTVQTIVDKYPYLYQYANVLSVVIAFIVVVAFHYMPEQIELWLKAAIALAGVSSVYNDYREAKQSEITKNEAMAIDLTSN